MRVDKRSTNAQSSGDRRSSAGTAAGFTRLGGAHSSSAGNLPSLIGADDDVDAPSPFRTLPDWDISVIESASPAVHRKRPRRSMGAALPSRPSRPSRLLAGRSSVSRDRQQKRRRTTIGGQSSVAKRILSTLGKMSTPLDEARRRRVPSALATKWVLDRYKETAPAAPRLTGALPPRNSLTAAMAPKVPSPTVDFAAAKAPPAAPFSATVAPTATPASNPFAAPEPFRSPLPPPHPAKKAEAVPKAQAMAQSTIEKQVDATDAPAAENGPPPAK